MTRTRKHRKLPNGFRQITCIKSRQFNPYRAMITVGHTVEGKPIAKLLKPVSYFKTYNDAFAALIEYNKSPSQKAREITLKQLFDEWLPLQESRVSDSSIRRYKNSFNRLKDYEEYLVIEIGPRIISLVIQKAWKESSVIGSRVSMLLNSLFDYAIANEIVETNYARNVKLHLQSDDVKQHISFTDEEISALWKHSDDLYCQWVLIQCYTGMRPSELCELKLENISIEGRYLKGGMKTNAGKDRLIPIHTAIEPLIGAQFTRASQMGSKYLLCDDKNKNGYGYQTYKSRFYELKNALELNPEHTLHDCRKFFVTTAKKYQLDEYALKRIVGHSISDVTESVYTERNISWLRSEIEKIKV